MLIQTFVCQRNLQLPVGSVRPICPSFLPNINMQVLRAQYQPTDRPIEDRITVAQPGALTDNRTVVGVFDGA